MRSGRVWYAVIFAALAALAQGCIVTTSPTCGGIGDVCCPGNACTAGTCASGVCMGVASCGTLGNVCCAGGQCPGGGTCSSSGVCTNPTGACGLLGDLCCSTGSPCATGGSCVAGVCMSTASCGNTGEVCCSGSVPCLTGVCSAGGICQSVSSGTPYALCTAVGSNCGGGTTCEQANHAPSGGTTGAFCTAQCTAGSPCPAATDGSALVCVPDEGDASSQCYEACSGTGACKLGFTCVQSAAGGPAYCAPGAAVGMVDPAYTQCNPGDSCTSGTGCAPANRTATGFSGAFCTAPCDISSPACPADEAGDPNVCVPDASSTTSGQCYLACQSGTCPSGLTCATDPGSSVEYCVP